MIEKEVVLEAIEKMRHYFMTKWFCPDATEYVANLDIIRTAYLEALQESETYKRKLQALDDYIEGCLI